jgi:hypothetical protein
MVMGIGHPSSGIYKMCTQQTIVILLHTR